MIIQFLGAAHDVTGSQYLLNCNGHKLLLDCGLYQGPRAESYKRNLKFQYDPSDLDAVILSHAHIDHSGNLPNLVKQGFQKRIYATPGTAALADVMLRDSGHIQESDAEYENRRRARRNEQAIQPLYTAKDAANVKQYFTRVDYRLPFDPIPGVKAQLVDAGHILGSAAVVLDIQENGRGFRFWFSGDIGRRKLPLIKDPVLPEKPNYLLMESTYGNRSHDNPEEAYRELREVVKRTIRRGGKVIIPAFAVGRTQELVYQFNQMMSNGEIPEIPVFVDSPLALSATRVFIDNPQYFDEETNEFIRAGNHPALNFKTLRYIESVEDSKAVVESNKPMIVISASGMAENGRILHHLRASIEDPNSTVVIVGWQAPGTLGRALANGEREVTIFGDPYSRLAEVVQISGFSAHAGQNMLYEYAMAAKDTVQEIILVHGEEEAAVPLCERLKAGGIKKVIYPNLYDTLEIG